MSNKTRNNIAAVHNLIQAAGNVEQRLPSGPRTVLETRREAAETAIKELNYLASLEENLIEWMDAEDDFNQPHCLNKDYHEARQRIIRATNLIRKLYDRKPIFGEDKCLPPKLLPLNGLQP